MQPPSSSIFKELKSWPLKKKESEPDDPARLFRCQRKLSRKEIVSTYGGDWFAITAVSGRLKPISVQKCMI